MERTRDGAEMVCGSGGVVTDWSATGIVYIFAQLGWVGTGKMLLVYRPALEGVPQGLKPISFPSCETQG